MPQLRYEQEPMLPRFPARRRIVGIRSLTNPNGFLHPYGAVKQSVSEGPGSGLIYYHVAIFPIVANSRFTNCCYAISPEGYAFVLCSYSEGIRGSFRRNPNGRKAIVPKETLGNLSVSKKQRAFALCVASLRREEPRDGTRTLILRDLYGASAPRVQGA